MLEFAWKIVARAHSCSFRIWSHQCNQFWRFPIAAGTRSNCSSLRSAVLLVRVRAPIRARWVQPPRLRLLIVTSRVSKSTFRIWLRNLDPKGTRPWATIWTCHSWCPAPIQPTKRRVGLDLSLLGKCVKFSEWWRLRSWDQAQPTAPSHLAQTSSRELFLAGGTKSLQKWTTQDQELTITK